MQTFLPYADFKASAACVDYRRLGKQRIEAKQLLIALSGQSKGWANHPAAKMWRGHEDALRLYGKTCCEEWIKRGYKDTTLPFFGGVNVNCKLPAWVGNEAFHLSHKSNLLRKDRTYYVSRFGELPNNLPYVWPVT